MLDRPRAAAALYLDLIRWDRPAGWLLLLWPTLSALWLAADGFPGWHLLLVYTLGTFLMRSAGCCVNDVADRDFDRHVKRTAQRPVTRGALSVAQALGFGAVLALAAFALVLTTNPPTILLSFAALAVALLYPFAKRVLAMPQAVLGVAFSFGIPMAFSAVLGGQEWSLAAPAQAWWLLLGNLFWVLAYDTEYAMVDRDDDLALGIGTSAIALGRWDVAAVAAAVPAQAWGLLAGNLFWVLAYDTEYAMVDRDDDLALAIKTSAITLGRFDVAAVMGFYATYLLSWALLGHSLGLGAVFLLGIALAAVQALWHFRLIRSRSREGCFKAFRLNHWLGFAVFVGVALDLGWR